MIVQPNITWVQYFTILHLEKIYFNIRKQSVFVFVIISYTIS